MSEPISYPDVNGISYDFSSIEFAVGDVTVPVLGVNAIDYPYELTPGDLFGTSPQKLARTRGRYKSDCSMTVYKAEEDLIIQAAEDLGAGFGLGFMEVSFDIIVIYADYNQQTITDSIVGCRIKKVGQSHKTGQDALMSKIEFDPMYVLPNGRVPYSNFAR